MRCILINVGGEVYGNKRKKIRHGKHDKDSLNGGNFKYFGLMLKPKHAAYTILIYLILGLIGMPIFSGGSAGPGKLFGPTGGFYFGFLAAVIVISMLKGKKNKFTRYAAVTIGLGIPIQHLFAILFMCFHNGFNIQAAAVTVSFPFIPGDIIKCLLASMLAVALNKVLQKQ